MKILITGGAGFIGSHLTESLLKKGHVITIIDDLSTGSKANLATVIDDDNLTLHTDSIENVDLLKSCVKNCDYVFHLAAAVGVKKIIEQPIDSMRRNIHCTDLVLSVVDALKKPILLASTSEVYGKGVKHKFEESDDLIFGPTHKLRWSYAASKAIDEFMALAYHRHQGLAATIVRFFNTVGPRQSHEYGMVIPRFVKQALAGDAITIFGDGKQTRCFGHVYDIVWALSQLMDEKKAQGSVLNIGNDEEVTILSLAERIISKTKSRSEIVHIDYADVYNNNGTFEDIVRRVPCIDRLHALIGYQPQYSLDNILDDVIAYYSGKEIKGVA